MCTREDSQAADRFSTEVACEQTHITRSPRKAVCVRGSLDVGGTRKPAKYKMKDLYIDSSGHRWTPVDIWGVDNWYTSQFWKTGCTLRGAGAETCQAKK